MARRIEAVIKPELLIWGRKSAGLDISVAAKKIGVKPEKLAAWEQGESRPTINQLRNAANAYKRPLAVFYLPAPPADFSALRDFRRLFDDQEAPLSPNAILAIRRAQYLRNIALDLSEQQEGQLRTSFPRIQLGQNAEKAADKIRDMLAITINNQFSWREKYTALNQWRGAIEKANVLIFQFSKVAVKEIRGFSINENPLPIIAINSGDAVYGRIFTLLHELTHIIIGATGICDLKEKENINTENNQVEIFCNLVAGAVLVPSVTLQNHPVIKSKPRTHEWSDQEIGELSRDFQVSREVIARRLLLIDRATKSFYLEKRAQYIKEFVEHTGGPVPVYRKVVSGLGRPFIGLVLTAYYQKTITASDLSDYLGARLKHLTKIESELRRGIA